MILENPEKIPLRLSVSQEEGRGNGRISAESKTTIILLGCTQKNFVRFCPISSPVANLPGLGPEGRLL